MNSRLILAYRKSAMADRKDPPDDLSAEERALFEAEMQGVRRVTRGRTRVNTPAATRPQPLRLPPAAKPADAEEESPPGETVSHFDPSVSADTRRALRRGDMQPEAVLDLHGARTAETRRRVETFLYEARAREQRCILIITGRGLRSGPGGPALRREVVQILSAGSLGRAVLGMVSAPPSLGGTGALLVLLRKIWKERRY